MPRVRVTFDPESDMSYIRLADPAKSGNAVRQVPVREPDRESARFVLDLDGEGRLLGVEVFDARSSLPDDVLDRAESP
jgi:uncharacterized protein YuzE